MTSAQLKELEQRCHNAAHQGYILGKGSVLAAMLMCECGEVEASPHLFGSPEHLLKIIGMVRAVRSGKSVPTKIEPEPVKKPEPEPVKKIEPEPVKKPEPEPEPVKKIEPEPVKKPEPESKKGKSKKN